MTWAGRSRSRSPALPVSARTLRTSPVGNALAITPRLMWSLTRMPAGRPAGMRAIVAARSRTSASMAQPCSYVNRIAVREDVMKHDRIRQAGCALCAAAVLGVAASARGAAAADLSPQDRCAIAKLEAASREAACLRDAQIAGIRQGLTDQQVDRRRAACSQRGRQS